MKDIKNIIGKIFNKNVRGLDENEIFLTKCDGCGKRIAVSVSPEHFCHGAYTCNTCIPKNSGLRNGIDEALETDLFDEIDDTKYEKIKEKLIQA